jgi:hypothetical protein
MEISDKRKTTLILLSPTLTKQIGGHNYNYNIALAKASEEFFSTVLIAANRHFKGEVSPPLEAVLERPSFAVWKTKFRFFFKKTDTHLPILLSGENGINKVLTSPDISLAKRLWLLVRGGCFARKYIRIIYKILKRFTTEIHIFVEDPSFWEIVLMPRLSKFKTNRTSWHILLRHPPEHFAQDFYSLADLKKRLCKLCSIKNIFFYTDTAELAFAYHILTGKNTRFTTVPVPVINGDICQKIKCEKKNELRLGYIGGARSDKGFHFLPWLYENLPGIAGGKNIIIATQIGPCTDKMSEMTSEKLRSIKNETGKVKIELFSDLNNKQYSKIFQSFDIMLLLYIDYRYRFSSSGIFLEAIQYDVPVLTFKDSWAGKIVESAAKTKLKIGITIDKLSQVPAAIKEIACNIGEYQNDMAIFQKQWLPEQNIRKVALAIARNAGV